MPQHPARLNRLRTTRATGRSGRVRRLVVCAAAGMLCLGATQVAAGAESAPAPGKTKIFKYLSGATPVFSDVPPSTIAYTVYRSGCFACNLHSAVNWHVTPLFLAQFVDNINQAARQFGLDPALVRAIIHAESGFNAQARSPKGALGLMQLMPATARDLGVTNALDPGYNIRGGAQYLAGLLAEFHGDVALAAAAYNAGPAAVHKYAGVPPYAETQVYVQRVKILLARYQQAPRIG